MKEAYLKSLQRDSESGTKLIGGKDELTTCMGDGQRAVSAYVSDWQEARSDGQVFEAKRTWLAYWEKEDGEWKIYKMVPAPLWESRVKNDWSVLHWGTHSAPPSFGDTKVVFTDKLVGIRVKAGETATVTDYDIGAR